MIKFELTKSARRMAAVATWRYRLHKRAQRRTALIALRAQQWLPPAELCALQSHKLQGLIQHVYNNVPYYRQAMKERGVRPEQIRSAEQLHLLPLLTKDTIREHFDQLRARGGVVEPRSIVTNHTGGSTGTPLTFLQDAAYGDWGGMNLVRNYEMCGYRLGDPIAFLWGSDYDARPHRTLRGKFRNLVGNTLFLDAFDCDERDLIAYAKQLAAFRPRLLVGYVSSLVLLARVVESHRVTGVRPTAIQSSAEVLTPAQRALLEQTFGCKVFDRYGCREVGNIAHECEAHTGLHVLGDVNIVETLSQHRPDGPAAAGEAGQIVLTNLHNFAMPLIRYVNGDLAVVSDAPCRCGRGLPLIQSVVGRSTDIIVAPSGKFLHGEFFTHLFYKLPTVREFQVIQRSPTLLDISLVPGPGFDENGALTFLRETILQYGDPAFALRFTVTNRIARSASGKFRFTISEVPVQLASQGAG